MLRLKMFHRNSNRIIQIPENNLMSTDAHNMVNTVVEWTYSNEYIVSDAAGNKSRAMRTVLVHEE